MMLYLTNEQFRERLNQLVGDTVEDSQLQIIEDVTSSYDAILADFDVQIKNYDDLTVKYDDLTVKYDENDSMWRMKYKNRFLSPSTTPEQIKNDTQDDVRKDDQGPQLTIDDLFKKREG